jgi:hypothetical protein
MIYSKGDKVEYKGKPAKVIGTSDKNGKTVYKLRINDKFNTIAYNVNSKELSKLETNKVE